MVMSGFHKILDILFKNWSSGAVHTTGDFYNVTPFVIGNTNFHVHPPDRLEPEK
jgi:hypothetical protein